MTRLKIIDQKIDRLTELLESNEIKQLRLDSEELKKIKDLLAHVKFKIKEVRAVDNQNTGGKSVIVTYELPRIVLELDENGNPNKNEFFYSVNMLNLVSFEDMMKVQKVLEKEKIK